MKHKSIDLVSDCPGGWYGCQPTAESSGHVIIDPDKLFEALAWLRRRCFVFSPRVTEDKGIMLRLQLKQSGQLLAAVKVMQAMHVDPSELGPDME